MSSLKSHIVRRRKFHDIHKNFLTACAAFDSQYVFGFAALFCEVQVVYFRNFTDAGQCKREGKWLKRCEGCCWIIFI